MQQNLRPGGGRLFCRNSSHRRLPTELGWHKGTGNIGCGWGSTYGHVDIEDSRPLEEFGRIELTGFTGAKAESDCCVEAMKYEATPMSLGGPAVRFDVYRETCRIDRALMMRGNLDASSGKSMDRLTACGGESERFYWRHASGAGDAANLQSAGRCVIANNFTKVKSPTDSSGDATKPLGQLPGFEAELPNHPSQPTVNAVVYNTISTAEGCCQACSSLQWIGEEGDEVNPCVAFQIVDGRCRILRLAWFDRYAEAGNGVNEQGNNAMGVTEVVAHCAGFPNHDACARADGSHGWWGSCADAECDYFSHMYYRDPGCLGCSYFPPAADEGNATFHKVQPVNASSDTEELTGIDVQFNVSVLRDRATDKIEDLVAGGSDAAAGQSPTDDGSWSAAGVVCGRIAVYPAGAVATDASGLTVLDEEALPAAIATSELLCIGGNDTEGEPAAVQLGSVGVAMNASSHPEVFGSDGGARRSGSQEGVVVSFECVGPGRDLCDFHSGSLRVSKQQVALVEQPPAVDDGSESGGDGGEPEETDGDGGEPEEPLDGGSEGEEDDTDEGAKEEEDASEEEEEDFAVRVVAVLAGVTAEQLRANLAGFREAVASVHDGVSAEEVAVDESSIADVETRRRLLAQGVSVEYQIRGFAGAAAAQAAKEVQESADSGLAESLKEQGFTSLESLSSTVTVLDSQGAAIVDPVTPEDSAAGRIVAVVGNLVAAGAVSAFFI